jgi:hypothetical protein
MVRFSVEYPELIKDNEKLEMYGAFTDDIDKVVDILNSQDYEINYWKQKVLSLLFILGQFDNDKVESLMEELKL